SSSRWHDVTWGLKTMRHIMERGHLRFCGSHVRPDWLQIYAIDRGQLILTASRTGTRSDLFDE
ncbi:MAG: hypothetical protein U0K60_04860, partial [Parafannyhessea umbonata]|nr:hypothetical protein [Parafannyhessea umbonata]